VTSLEALSRLDDYPEIFYIEENNRYDPMQFILETRDGTQMLIDKNGYRVLLNNCINNCTIIVCFINGKFIWQKWNYDLSGYRNCEHISFEEVLEDNQGLLFHLDLFT
jgi:hypothetical protein